MSGYAFITAKPSVAYLFPGQGSQFVGMGQDLAAAYPSAQDAFEEADEILGFPVSDLCFNGPDSELTDTINAQPALLATSIAAMRALEAELGGAVDSTAHASSVFVAGHSMGEYSALVAAGVLSYEDGLKLVRVRGQLMKEAGERRPGMMAAILGLEQEQVAGVCADCRSQGDLVQIANDNCPGQIVISGDEAGMTCAMTALVEAGARKVVQLAVSIASHSPLMDSAIPGLSRAVAEAAMNTPSVPVIGNTTASTLSDLGAIRSELVSQLTGPVRWTETMQFMLNQGVTDFVEIGAGQVLVGLARRVDRKAGRHSVGDVAGVKAYAAWLSAGQ